VAFLAQEAYERPPVVLVDEAETHLHYDAQADLVRVFSEQDAAAMVIYTTHSAGCLPLDLGLGVRAVVAEPNDTSKISNSMWELGSGLSPILLAMGASVLAFTRARRAIIGEGASEALLLPTLLKEAVGAAEVDYQIAPGVANASPEAVAELEDEAVAVGYLLDGDKGGRDHAKRLLDAGVPEDRILFLGGSPTSGLTLEDLVSRSVYAAAVNEVFSTWHPDVTYPVSAVATTGRAASLAAWCRRRHIAPPDKKRIAARLLDAKRRDRSRPLVSQAGQGALRKLHADAKRVLDRSARAEDAP
jgi:predicted ATP-dependent endonuclease of OLD family